MLKSKLSYIPFYLLTFIIALVIGVKLISNYKEEVFSTYSNLLAGILILFIALLVLVVYIFIPRIKIYETEVTISNFINKSRFFNLNDIESFYVLKTKSKSGDYETLYLMISPNQKIRLKSYSYSNYYDLKSQLIKNKPKNNYYKSINELKRLKLISLVISSVGFIFILIGLRFINYGVYRNNDIQLLQGVLNENIILKKGRKSRYSLIIKLKDYENFNFKINTLAFKETFYEALIKNCQKGDSILLTLDKEEFNKKIANKKDISLYDKLYYFNQIDVLAVEDENYVYLSLKDYNELNIKNDYLGIGFFGFFGIILVVLGSKGVFKSNNELNVIQNESNS